MKIANVNARKYVQKRIPFSGSNLMGSNVREDMYVVFSYGSHWPLFIYTNGQWYENEDRTSVTTSKHRTQTHPRCPTMLLSIKWMERLATNGYQALVKARIVEGEEL
jgi:hypothetical protein